MLRETRKKLTQNFQTWKILCPKSYNKTALLEESDKAAPCLQLQIISEIRKETHYYQHQGQDYETQYAKPRKLWTCNHLRLLHHFRLQKSDNGKKCSGAEYAAICI